MSVALAGVLAGRPRSKTGAALPRPLATKHRHRPTMKQRRRRPMERRRPPKMVRRRPMTTQHLRLSRMVERRRRPPMKVRLRLRRKHRHRLRTRHRRLLKKHRHRRRTRHRRLRKKHRHPLRMSRRLRRKRHRRLTRHSRLRRRFPHRPQRRRHLQARRPRHLIARRLITFSPTRGIACGRAARGHSQIRQRANACASRALWRRVTTSSAAGNVRPRRRQIARRHIMFSTARGIACGRAAPGHSQIRQRANACASRALWRRVTTSSAAGNVRPRRRQIARRHIMFSTGWGIACGRAAPGHSQIRQRANACASRALWRRVTTSSTAGNVRLRRQPRMVPLRHRLPTTKCPRRPWTGRRPCPRRPAARHRRRHLQRRASPCRRRRRTRPLPRLAQRSLSL